MPFFMPPIPLLGKQIPVSSLRLNEKNKCLQIIILTLLYRMTIKECEAGLAGFGVDAVGCLLGAFFWKFATLSTCVAVV